MVQEAAYSLFNPDPALVLIALVVSLAVAMYQLYCGGQDAAKQKEHHQRLTKAVETEEKLRKEQLGQKRLVRVDEAIYVAVGYGAANSIMIEGVDGCVIIDTMDSKEAAAEVLGDFRAVTQKPIAALILTHNHPHHVTGLEVFLASIPAAREKVRVYAHQSFARNKKGTAEKDPIYRFKDRLSVDVAGLQLELVHLPGDSDDHIVVWWPETKTLFSGKNFCTSFPDAYGKHYSRDCKKRIDALQVLLDFDAGVLVPQCARPLVHKDLIHSLLTAQRDALQFIHEQTVRHVDEGIMPDEIVRRVKLPATLADHPFLLRDFQNSVVESTIRGICEHCKPLLVKKTS